MFGGASAPLGADTNKNGGKIIAAPSGHYHRVVKVVRDDRSSANVGTLSRNPQPRNENRSGLQRRRALAEDRERG